MYLRENVATAAGHREYVINAHVKKTLGEMVFTLLSLIYQNLFQLLFYIQK